MTKDSKNLVTLFARKPLLWFTCSDVQSSGRKSLYAEAEAKALLPGRITVHALRKKLSSIA